MKKILLGAAIALTMVACKTETKETITTKDVKATTEKVAQAITGKDVAANLEASTVWYKGSKIVGDSHDGNIALKSAKFVVNNDKLVGGEFILDMDKMTNNDLSGKGQSDFLAHMKAPDFFDVAKYPTAKFEITSVKEKNVTGNLTIKETTKEITIPATITIEGESVSLDSEFTFDRTDFGMEFNSESKAADLAKNRIIKNAVEVKVSVKS